MLLLAASCRPEPVTVRADIPVDANDKSVIIAVRSPAGAPQVRAFDVVDGEIDPPWLIDLEESSSLSIDVLAYERTLAELDVTAGTLTPVEEGPRRALPEPARVFHQTITDDLVDEWTRLDALPEALAAIRIESPCHVFDVTKVSLPEDVPATFLVAVDDRLLLGNAAGGLYIASPDGTFARLVYEGVFADAYAEDDGTLHLVGARGRVVRARLVADEFEVLEDETVGAQDLHFVAGDPAGGTIRFVSSISRVHAHDEEGWREAFSVPKPRGMSWIGDGRVRGIFGYESDVRGLEDGEDAVDAVHSTIIAGGITALGFVEGFGAVAGTEFGQLYLRRRQNDWLFLQGLDPALLQIRDIVAYRDGFLYARPDGILEVVGTVACPHTTPIGPTNDPERPELGDKVEDIVETGHRSELTVVGIDVAALALVGAGARVQRLVWFRPR